MKTIQKALAFIAIAIAIVVSQGCASGSAFHITTVGATAAHLSLTTTSKFADAQTCGVKTAAPGACLSAEQRQAVAKVLDPAFQWDATLNEQLAQAGEGPIPQLIADLRAQITKAINEALALFKGLPGVAQDKLAAQIGATK